MNRPELGPLRVIWSYKVWIGIVTIVSALVSWYISDSKARAYETSTQVQVLSGRQLNLEFVGQQELQQLVNVSAALAGTRSVRTNAYAAAAEDLGVAPTAVAGSIAVIARPQIQTLDFIGRAGNPNVAAALSNAYANEFASFLEARQTQQRNEALARIQARIDEILDDVDDDDAPSTSQAELQALQQSAASLLVRSADAAHVIQPAVPPSTPVSPTPTRDAVLTGIAVLFLAALLVSVLDRLRDRYASADDAAEDLRLPMLGELPRLPAEDPIALEAIRSLRTNVSFAMADVRRPLLMTTSATPKAGKTYVTTNLARSFAAEGNQIVTIDGDLRRPAMHERFGLPLHPGIGDLVASDTTGPPELTAQAVATSSEVAGRGGRLDAVTAGRHVADPAEALATDTMRRALMTLRVEYDIVLVDSPPLLAVSDPVVLSRYADAVLLVVGARRERRSDVRRALATLRAVNANVIGVVFNSSSSKRRGYSQYGSTTKNPVGALR